MKRQNYLKATYSEKRGLPWGVYKDLNLKQKIKVPAAAIRCKGEITKATEWISVCVCAWK